jgi:hypothetical protein
MRNINTLINLIVKNRNFYTRIYYYIILSKYALSDIFNDSDYYFRKSYFDLPLKFEFQKKLIR